MSDDVLITPASRKVEFFDSGGNIDGTIQLSAAGDLNITSTGKIIIGDIAHDIHIGDGAQAVDLVFDFTSSIYSVANQDLTIGRGSEGGNDVTIDGASAVLLSLAGTEQARLTSTGLGLGVTAPTDTLAVDGGIKIGEFNSTDTGLYADGAPSSHNSATGASDPQIRVAGRTYDQPGIIQMAFFDQNNFFGGTGRFTLGRLQYAMNENSNSVTTVAEIRGVTDDGTQSGDQQTAGNFDGALTFWTSQGDGTSANLTEKMILTGDGYLGIGTASPGHLLEVAGGGANGEIVVNRTSGAEILLQAQSSTGVIGTNTNHNLDIKTNGSTRMRIETDGDVGIGTTTPSSKLHVAGDTTIYNGTSEAHLILRRNATGVNYGSAIKWRFGDSGSSSSGHEYARITGNIQDSTDGSEDGYLTLQTSRDGTLTEAIRINKDGQVGIGTSSPDAPLHVEHSSGLIAKFGEGNVETRMQFADARAMIGYVGDSLMLQSGSGGKTIRFAVNNGTFGSGEVARFDTSGNLGIGTTAPEALLDVNTGSGIAIQMGADVNATTLTDDTRKYGRFATPHYHNAEEPIGLIVGDSDGTDNIVNIGGGSNAVNAATSIKFWSAANDATVTGTVQANITSSGLQLGTSGARVTTILDEDAMGSDSATALATQQSIKAYVDANAGASLANDANNRVVTATGSGGLNGEANMTFNGTTNVLAVTGQLTATTSSIGSYHIVQAANFVTRDGVAINGTNTTAMTSEGATHRFSSAHILAGNLANGSDVELFRFNVTNATYRKMQGGKMYVRIQDTATGGFFQETVTFAYTGDGTTPVIYSSTDRLDSQMAGTQSSYDHEKATILVEFVTDHIRVKFSNDTGSTIVTSGWDARVTCTLFEMEALTL